MKAAELRQLSQPELEIKLAELEDKLFKLRFQKVQGQMENPGVVGKARKDVARIKTILTQKKIEG